MLFYISPAILKLFFWKFIPSALPLLLSRNVKAEVGKLCIYCEHKSFFLDDWLCGLACFKNKIYREIMKYYLKRRLEQLLIKQRNLKSYLQEWYLKYLNKPLNCYSFRCIISSSTTTCTIIIIQWVAFSLKLDITKSIIHLTVLCGLKVMR